MPYHVRLYVEGQRGSPEVKLDLDEATLERQFMRPYHEGTSITVNGRTIQAEEIHRLLVSYSDAQSQNLIDQLKLEDARSDIPMIGGASYALRVAASAKNVTDEFIQGPPGVDRPSEPWAEPSLTSSDTLDPRLVFLVYGRWEATVQATRELLGALDLKVIEWEQAVQATGKANPYIGEILDAGFSRAFAAVVLMTPDDLACLHPDLRSPDEGSEQWAGQPRPNVLFEAGMAWQKFRNRTVLVTVGHLRGFSDLAGVHTIRLDGSPESRRSVASRLKTIGCAVDDAGDRWLTAGHFPPQLRPITPADFGFEIPEIVEPRGVPAPADVLKGIPLRWILLARLAEMHREQATADHILLLDVSGIAAQAAVELNEVKEVLSELVSEGLIEGYAESFGQTAVDGACRITGAGLRRLRAEA